MQAFFAAEPVVDDDSPLVPYPWGLRMDGLSLISTRRWGWMELGFRRSYFHELFRRAGWGLAHVALDHTFWASIYTARRLVDVGDDGKPTEKDASATSGPVENGAATRSHGSGSVSRLLRRAADLAARSEDCVREEGWVALFRKAQRKITASRGSDDRSKSAAPRRR